MPRAQCIVTRGRLILMAKHSQDGLEWWCLPGGGIEPGETPEQAALRELGEECGVTGRIVRQTSVYADPACDHAAYTFQIDIGTQSPTVGRDPEIAEDQEQVLKDIRWLSLAEIPERDRVFLWSAGLVAVPGFWEEVERWGGDLSYPATAEVDRGPTPYADVNAAAVGELLDGSWTECLMAPASYGLGGIRRSRSSPCVGRDRPGSRMDSVDTAGAGVAAR